VGGRPPNPGGDEIVPPSGLSSPSVAGSVVASFVLPRTVAGAIIAHELV
jgi:hypothetical protein